MERKGSGDLGAQGLGSLTRPAILWGVWTRKGRCLGSTIGTLWVRIGFGWVMIVLFYRDHKGILFKIIPNPKP